MWNVYDDIDEDKNGLSISFRIFVSSDLNVLKVSMSSLATKYHYNTEKCPDTWWYDKKKCAL